MRMHGRSAELFRFGQTVVPNGVSSPMRSFSLVGGDPICAVSAKGSTITDADGNVYIDFLNAFGAVFLGHAREEIVAALADQVSRGTVYGLSTELEYQLAEKIVRSTPAIEKIRFVCSGTEAVMTCVRIARCHTKRSLIVKFVGSYHGHSDSLLASPANLDVSATRVKGVTKGIVEQLNRDVILCDYNDVDQLDSIFAAHGDRIAAVLVEPFATNMGFVKPIPGFHPRIRELCNQHGSLLIFDEVVTGFRFTFGGACKLLDIDPDMVTFGKIIGGGTPIGAFAGKARYMRHVAIGNEVFQSGTFAANRLSLAAGNAALGVLAQPGFYEEMEKKGAWLEASITEQFSRQNIPFLFSRFGALVGIAYRDSQRPMRSYKDVKTQDYDLFKRVHRRMLNAGFLLAPSIEEPIFVSAAHTYDDLSAFAESLAASVSLSSESTIVTERETA